MEYEPRRKIYGVFCFIDSLNCPARGADCKLALFIFLMHAVGISGNNGYGNQIFFLLLPNNKLKAKVKSLGLSTNFASCKRNITHA